MNAELKSDRTIIFYFRFSERKVDCDDSIHTHPEHSAIPGGRP